MEDGGSEGQCIMTLKNYGFRKELRLRGVQERLVETSHRLEAAEARLAEHEALPGWRQYRACCGLYTALTRAGWGGAGLLRGGLTHSLHMVYQVCRTWALVIGSAQLAISALQ